MLCFKWQMNTCIDKNIITSFLLMKIHRTASEKNNYWDRKGAISNSILSLHQLFKQGAASDDWFSACLLFEGFWPCCVGSRYKRDSSSWICYLPSDGLSTDSISALLASYPDADVAEHVSINGWGMLYWRATLSPVQWQEVISHKQVWYYLNSLCKDKYNLS